jgi:hypothetical protein
MRSDTEIVRSFANRNEAEFAQQLLRAHGIESQVKGDDASGWLPHLSLASGGFALRVMTENHDAASEVLADRFDSTDESRKNPS